MGILVTPYFMLSSGREAHNRYTQAVEQLTSDRSETRTAAIHALARVARDSPPDRLAVRDTLAAYIRENSPATDEGLLPTLDPEIASALTVLADLSTDPADDPPLDLRAIHAPHSSLAKANLNGAYLNGAYLNEANLTGANLSGADLHIANLFGANLEGADLRGAYLSNATLSGATLDGAHLRGATLDGTDLSGVNLRGADLRGVNLSTARGIVPNEIRAVAVTDGSTLF
ncbi:pentapeptide repeat protein [Actinocorallia herbida]|uniref:Pentapeptide repeat protein n=1 Tax=Actinocorallia herbida TaxID=58109 RepID=A0A3N1D728_9ACTN|nr:pentapeptide repeat protein [Actinocorallia herbida]